MGRSSSVTGPYLDKNGLDMRNGAGSLLLKREGKFIGILHFSINYYLTYHLKVLVMQVCTMMRLVEMTGSVIITMMGTEMASLG